MIHMFHIVGRKESAIPQLLQAHDVDAARQCVLDMLSGGFRTDQITVFAVQPMDWGVHFIGNDNMSDNN